MRLPIAVDTSFFPAPAGVTCIWPMWMLPAKGLLYISIVFLNSALVNSCRSCICPWPRNLLLTSRRFWKRFTCKIHIQYTALYAQNMTFPCPSQMKSSPQAYSLCQYLGYRHKYPAKAAHSSVEPLASLGSDQSHKLRQHQGTNFLAFRWEVHLDVHSCVNNLLSISASPWLILPSLYSTAGFAFKRQILHGWPLLYFISQSLPACMLPAIPLANSTGF